ncbi:MAG: diguanylate cyclase, partial [Candidatus Nanopelagicales bacterium]
MEQLDAPEGGAGGKPSAPPSRPAWALSLFLAAVTTVGMATLFLALMEAPPLRSLTDSAWEGSSPHAVVILVLAFAVIIGELRPVPVPRGGDSHDSITISTTFTVALVILGPVSVAMLAQGLAVLIDDIRRRKSIDKIVFNLAQYTLAIALARLVFCLMAGTDSQDYFGVGGFFEPTMRNFWAGVAASLTFLLVNHVLVSTVVALASGRPAMPVLLEDLRFQAMTAGVLAVLGPVAAVTVEAQPLMLPLLVAPVVAVYNSATLAVAKEQQAYHDSLTGLANRELFRDRSVRALEESKRTNTPLAIMMIDLDHFKEINDTLGHQVGDELI